MDERQLIARCCRKDKEAWDRFVEVYGPWILKAASYLVRQHPPAQAEELSHEIYQRVFVNLLKNDCRSLKSFQPEKSKLTTWLVTIARREGLAYLESLQQRTHLLKNYGSRCRDLVQEYAPSPDGEEARRLLREALKTLPARDQLILRLFYFEDLGYSEISRLLGISEKSLSVYFTRAREQLRQFLSSRKL